ncbi:DUF7848 domain-containing protein [Streptomyces sp. 8N706]|uniref:DUF7848 domain-containing protein n=1 Tax=Streptomyces sp. 8N706 TaxID=3457416 RepID=UPI003FCEF3CD
MTRAAFRYVHWTMGRETAPEAPEMVHEMECTTCNAESGAQDDFEAARDWAFAHTGGNPSHRGYREIVTRFWRMTPEGGGGT